MPTKATTVGRQRRTLVWRRRAAGAKFVVGEFVRASGGTLDDVGDAIPEVEKQRIFKWREKARRESPAVKGGPEAIARPTKVASDRSGVEAGVDACEEDDEIFWQ